MLRVLQVTGTMNCGGAEVMLMDILRNKPQDVHFDFLINNPPEDLYREGFFDTEIRSLNCEIRHIGTQLRIGPLNYIRRFREIFDELKPDVVHIHLNAKCGLIALAAHLAGCKRIISHCHADIRFRGSLLSRMLNEGEVFVQKFLISHFATDYWGCSKEANKRLYWPWVRRKSVVVNNAIDCSIYQYVDQNLVDELRKSYNLSEDTIVLGNVGRIVPHKNIAFVLEVMAELKSRGQHVVFVIAGRDDSPDYTAEMINRARDLGLSKESLIFLGERSDIPVVMQTFDAFVGPAFKEGFGLVAVEAQASAVPCVLYKGFPSAVDMMSGLCTFIDNFNAHTWADAILESQTLKTINKEFIIQKIKALGFDARENSIQVCNYYLSASTK